MAKGYNQQIVTGNLGRDAELVVVGEKNTPKASFSVAATTGFGKSEHTEWFDVVVWGKRAEALTQYLTKGQKVLVTGETRTRSWDGEDGQKHYRTEVVITPYFGDVVLLGNGQRSQAQEEPVGEEGGSDIPF
jgi:single-strand DNA-binding protein